jgi:hypothetical protein
MPGKIVKPCPLNFDFEFTVRVGFSLVPKLIFALFAFKFCGKSTRGNAGSVRVFHGLDTPVGISIFSQRFDGACFEPFDGVDMASTETPDGVVFDQGYPSSGCFVASDIKAENPVAHS